MTDTAPAREIFHFARPDAWRSAQSEGVYRPEEFSAEGFIHCATEAQIDGVVARHLRGHGPRVRLRIDAEALGEDLVYEWSQASEDLYPHVFGALPVSAVREAVAFDPDA
ncbi:MAG: DUF952 domain-containing protein [Xanthomonadales bacterium]|nr:DUF952 domain-containing protein [Xanthomonadales bacterium]